MCFWKKNPLLKNHRCDKVFVKEKREGILNEREKEDTVVDHGGVPVFDDDRLYPDGDRYGAVRGEYSAGEFGDITDIGGGIFPLTGREQWNTKLNRRRIIGGKEPSGDRQARDYVAGYQQ